MTKLHTVRRYVSTFLLVIGLSLISTLSAVNIRAGGLELVNLLTSQLGISESQALGGSGAIFSLARQKLGRNAFSQLEQGIPEMTNYLEATPRPDLKNAALSNAFSAFDHNSNYSLGKAIELKNAFDALDMGPKTLAKFTPIVTDYVRSKSGSTAASLLSGLF